MEDGTGATCWVITGVMASGKSTVADLLARRFARAVHLRGDTFRKMIVAGQDPIGPTLGAEAMRQLELRRRLTVAAAHQYWGDDFTVVVQDIYVGEALINIIESLTMSPLYVVVLTPRPEVVAQREEGRQKVGYVGWRVDEFCAALERDTPRVGLWLDSSELSPHETVEEILQRRAEALVR